MAIVHVHQRQSIRCDRRARPRLLDDAGRHRALPDIERAMVICAVHRLREKGVLQIHHALGVGFIYSPAQGATRPIDGRGRPRKREQRRAGLNLGPLLNAAERQAR